MSHASRNQKTKTAAICGAVALALIGGIGIGRFLGDSDGERKNSRPAMTQEEIELIKSIPKPKPRNRSLDVDAPSEDDSSGGAYVVNALDGINDPDTTIESDIRILDHLFAEVQALFHSLPTGDHTEIVRFLEGDNPKGFAYFNADNPALNEQGQIIDRWGTPFFFHVVSRHEIEVRSAGPDQLHWSEDDIVSNRAENLAQSGRL